MRGNAHSGRDEFRGTFGLRIGATHGNPEPSRRYTAGRCRDYLRASAPLMTGRSIPHPHARIASPIRRRRPYTGEEIVHSRRKRRARVNPLVLGSNPSGPIGSTRSPGAICNIERAGARWPEGARHRRGRVTADPPRNGASNPTGPKPAPAAPRAQGARSRPPNSLIICACMLLFSSSGTSFRSVR